MNASTLIDFVCRSETPSVVVRDARGRSIDGVTLCNGADALGAALAGRGVEPGDTVAAYLPPGAELLAATLGAAAIRAAIAPVASLRDPRVARARLVLVGPGKTPARLDGVSAISVAFDAAGTLLVGGEPVYDAHQRIAEADDVVLIPALGRPLSQKLLVEEVGERGVAGLLEVLAAHGGLARRAA